MAVLVGTPNPDTLDGTPDGDLILGRGAGDQVDGLDGDDRLFGGPGADTLIPGTGVDQLEGGAGADSFTFGRLMPLLNPDTGVGEGERDVITDFEQGSDTIDLSRYENPFDPNPEAPLFLGTGAFVASNALQVRYEPLENGHTLVQFAAVLGEPPPDVEPPVPGGPTGEVELAGAYALSAGDFILEPTTDDVAPDLEDAAAVTFNYTGDFQTYTVPETGSYNIVATGASGGTGNARQGSNSAAGGFGAQIEGIFDLTAGDVLTIAVGGQGENSRATAGPAGGGGGSFVVGPDDAPLLVAGGGGGGAVGGNEAQSRGVSATGEAASNGKSASFIPHESTAGGTAGSDGSGGGAGHTGSGGDGYSGGGGGGFSSAGGNGDDVGNAGGGGGDFLSGLAGGAGGGGNGGAGGFGGGGGGGYLGGGGGSGGSFFSVSSASFGTATTSGNGLVVITPLDTDVVSDTPADTDWDALAAQVTANHAATGEWFV